MVDESVRLLSWRFLGTRRLGHLLLLGDGGADEFGDAHKLWVKVATSAQVCS